MITGRAEGGIGIGRNPVRRPQMRPTVRYPLSCFENIFREPGLTAILVKRPRTPDRLATNCRTIDVQRLSERNGLMR